MASIDVAQDTPARLRAYATELTSQLTPEKVYEKRWALSLFDRALDRLRIATAEEVDPILGLDDPLVDDQFFALVLADFGQETLDRALVRFVEDFPPPAVYQQEIAPAAYLAGETEGVPHREMVLDDILQLWLDNANPAASPFTELFDDVVRPPAGTAEEFIWKGSVRLGPNDLIALPAASTLAALSVTASFEKSTLPNSIPIGGMMTSLTNELTIFPNAAPMMTPTARSTTLPFSANVLNSDPTLMRVSPP